MKTIKANLNYIFAFSFLMSLACIITGFIFNLDNLVRIGVSLSFSTVVIYFITDSFKK